MNRQSSLPTSCGYIADFTGEAILTPAPTPTPRRIKRSLQESDKKTSLRLYTGDIITAVKPSSVAYLVVYGKRVKVVWDKHFKVPSEEDQTAQNASHTAHAGRGAAGSEPQPYETFALFAQQRTEARSSLVPNPDGTLPLVWVAEKDTPVSITLTIEIEENGKVTEKSRTITLTPNNGERVAGFPFYGTTSKALGIHIFQYMDKDIARNATITLKNKTGKINTTRWQIENRTFTLATMEKLKTFSPRDFDGLDDALQFCEEGYEGQRAFLVFEWWRKNPTHFWALNMLHFLTLEYRFDALQAKLKKILDSQDHP
jgi:hypothetical protein